MKKLLLYLLVAVSLVVGVVGALTAYLPSIATDDAPQRLSGLHLNAPAGTSASTDPSGALKPLVPDETKLTEQSVRELQAANVKRVRVREFAFGRWSGRWMFALGCTGLLVAGLFLRAFNRAALSTMDSAAAERTDDPAALLLRLREEVEQILQQAAAPAVIVERVGELQKTLMPAMIAARSHLIGVGGLARYAYLMDAYAAAERALNRAWSSAADDDVIEATTALRRASALLDESAARLPERLHRG